MKSTSTLTILRDTREKHPIEFEKYPDVRVWKQSLSCGDYSLFGFVKPDEPYSIVIERKATCQELVLNLGSKWDSFCREMEKLQKYHTKLILVEDNWSGFQELIDKKYTKLSLNFIRKQLDICLLKYNVPTIFLGSKENVEYYIYRLFKRNLNLFREEDSWQSE